MELRDCPIGIFDSGIGGLTVVKEIIDQCPNEKLIYFGDTARLPYGNKSPETVINYCRENIQFLLNQNVKLIIIACNTATAFALDCLREEFEIPILGVIDAGASTAVKTTKNGKIGVLATKGTIASNIYRNKISSLNPLFKVFQVACPLFVPIVEEAFYNHPATHLIIEYYLAPLKQLDIDTILLGCTHYPMLLQSLQNYFGDAIRIVDSASTCAQEVKSTLLRLNLNRLNCDERFDQYFVSDSPNEFQNLSSIFFKRNIDSVQLIHQTSFVYN